MILDSTTTTTAPTAAPTDKISEYGTVITSVLFGGAFIAALVYAYIAKDTDSKNLLVGAVIANANTVVQYFLGSSRGGQKKDQTIASIALGAPAPTTTTTTVPTPTVMPVSTPTPTPTPTGTLPP